MPYKFLDIVATPSVQAVQAANGSRQMWEHFKGHRTFDRFTENEVAFIEARDSFYMASVSESGWPYVQHRGGPTGFLKVLDDKPSPSRIFAAICNISASATSPPMIASLSSWWIIRTAHG
jgi:hypothetical protein